MLNRFFTRRLSMVLAVAAGLLISACGGGNDDKLSPPLAAAVLPEILSISAPPNPDLSEAVAYTHSAATMSGLTFVWNFGDGSNSTEAAPKHRYSKAGDYEVSLIVSNSAGKSKESKIKVSVNNLAGVRGLVCSGANDTGWCWQAPQPSGNYSDSFVFANSNTGWRVGRAGEILKTQDGGKTWQRQQSGASANLYEIRVFDDKIAWVLGANKTLLHTVDGGLNWRALVSPLAIEGSESPNPNGFMTVISASSLMLASYTARYYSDNSGLTWDRVPVTSPVHTERGVIYGIDDSRLLKSTPTSRYPNEVLRLEDGTGLSLAAISIGVSGEHVVLLRGRTKDQMNGDTLQYGKPLAWRSEDAGLHWTPFTAVGLPTGSEMRPLYSLDQDGKYWFTQYGGHTYRSDDGGLNWKEQVNLRYGMNDEDESLSQMLVLGSRVLVKPSIFGTYQYSDDFGKTWVDMRFPEAYKHDPFTYREMQLVHGLLLLKGQFGSEFISADQGNSWKQVFTTSNVNNGSFSVAFANANNGVLVNSLGQLKTSKDGGRTWQTKNNDLPISYRYSSLVQFVDPTTAYLLRQDGSIYKSKDNGTTWSATGLNSPSTNFGFFDENNGWAHIGITQWPIVITRDGGNNWNPLATPSLNVNSVWLDNTSTVTIASDGGLISQFVEGRAGWQQRYTGTNKNLSKVYSFDGKIMWAIGDSATVLRSDDAGLNWKPVLVPGQVNFNDMQFADAKTGWIVGQQGFALATQDGGVTWKQQNTGTNVDLLKVQFVDTKTGWLVGANATLLATGTGGF